MNHRLIAPLLAAYVAVIPAVAENPQNPNRNPNVRWPGRQPDGSVLLPNLWSLRPVGHQIAMGDFPVNIAVHPDNRFAAVLHCGFGQNEIVVVDLRELKIISRTKIDEAFYGLEFSYGGNRLYCSGAASEVIRVFNFDDGNLTADQEIPLRNLKERGIPAGMAVSAGAQELYVANVWGQRVAKVDLLARTNVLEILLGEASKLQTTNALSPTRPVDFDAAAITKRDEAQLDPTDQDAPFPYACRLDERRQRLYVSLWAQAAVAVIDLKANRVEAHWPAGDHPNEMLLTKSGDYLYVANGNHDTITVFNTKAGLPIETLDASLYPTYMTGSTPNSLALTPDEEILFVANAGNNNVAVFDVSERGKSRSLGLIPVGWYPTSVRVTRDGKRLLVANGKGLTSKANPNGPRPDKKNPSGTIVEHIGGLMNGTLSVIDLPERKAFDEQMKAYTAIAYSCSPMKPDGSVSAARPTGNPIPLQLGEKSPIKYCIYVIKENRTYDQVFGDLPQGNGDPKLCLFPEKITPNHHQLAREFVLLDNFYVEGEVSADGHEWTMGAYATDFVEKTWPQSYGHNKLSKYPYPAEGRFPVAVPASGYLWDRAREAGVSYRSYGEFVQNGKTTNAPATTRVAALQGHFDPWYHGFDMDYSDLKRADRFISELKRFEKEGDMPRLQIVRLPNDHTAGTTPGKLTPTACVADNDLAFGRLVEAISKSKFWPQTAIFVVEDDAQNGPDHVDAHRTIAFVISPYAKRNAVDSTMYSTSSMLRTMELILGLRPMTQFDAAATPMFNSFQAQPDLRPYTALQANVDLNERNTKLAWGSEKSRKMDFSKEDAVDDLLLNEVIWRSIKGADNPMPAPVRSAFVLAHPQGDDDD